MSARRSMATVGVLLVAAAAVLSSAFDTQAVSPPASLTVGDAPLHVMYVPIGGLRNSGVTLVNPTGTLETGMLVSDQSKLRVGGLVRVDNELMLITGLIDGVPDLMSVQRAYRTPATGCTWCSLAAIHDVNDAVWTDFTEVKLPVSGVPNLETGVTLSQTLDAQPSEPSGALIAQAIGTGETTVNVSDASVLEGATTGRFDGVTHVSTIESAFLGSTGRAPSCGVQELTANSVWFGCTTFGDQPPTGPNGSAILATVRLNVRPQAAVSLDLYDVELLHPNPPGPFCLPTVCPPIVVQEVLDGWIAVGGAPQPPAIPPPTTGFISVYASPAGQLASVGADVDVNIWVNNVTDLGGFAFKVKWDPAPEDVTIASVRRGYIDDSGLPWNRGIVLTSNIAATATVVPISDSSAVQRGWTALVGTEEMVVTSVSPASLTVVRGYRGTVAAAHTLGDLLYVGPERAGITRAAAPVPHGLNAELMANSRVMRVNTHVPLAGASSLKVDSEKFTVMQLPARTYQPALGSLVIGIDATNTVITVPATVAAGAILRIDNELMMVIAKAGGNATVSRGFFGSSATSHGTGASIAQYAAEANSVRVKRGIEGTALAAHNPPAAVLDADGLGSYGYTFTVAQPATGQFTASQAAQATLSGAVDTSITSIPISSYHVLVNNDNDFDLAGAPRLDEDPLNLADNDGDGPRDEDPAVEVGSATQAGWKVIVGTGAAREIMRITGFSGDGPGGAQDVMTVQRGYGSTAAAHGPGDPVSLMAFAIISAVDGGFASSTGRTVTCGPPSKTPDSLTVACSSSGAALGAIGAGMLSRVRVSGIAMVPRSPARAASLSAVSLSDVSGSALATGTTQGTLKLVRCPDFDGNGIVNSTGDFVAIANAVFKNQSPSVVHDLDMNGILNSTGDIVAAANLIFLSLPQPLRCAPYGS